jgi:DNA-binding MarR family transcriptional regulator
MKIEEELKTKKFVNEKQKAVLSVLFTASWLSGKFACVIRPFGLSEPQYNILRILNGSYPNSLSVLDIKTRMIDRMSNVSRLVEKLKAKGLVERKLHLEDRRRVEVSITQKGQLVLKEIYDASPDPAKYPESLYLRDAKEMGRILDKMRE